MKLITLVLLVIAAIAAAVPAPFDVTPNTSDPTPGPDVPLLLNVTVDVNAPATGGDVKNQPGFFAFDITFYETYNGGDSLLVTADFWYDGGKAKFEFTDTNQMMWARVNQRDLQITYDYEKHDANFAFDQNYWHMDHLYANGRGMCVSYVPYQQRKMNGYDGVWNKKPLSSGSAETRMAAFWCTIDIQGMPSRRALEKLEPVAARENIPGLNTNREIATVAQRLTTTDTGDATSRIGYYDFTLSVTEYCEASEGTPLKARGWWSNQDSSAGQKISFGDSRSATEINLGYPGVNLRVGPYDFWTHRVGLHYGGCHFDQDIDGVGKCGICNSGTWSSSELNCAMNPAAGRTHEIMCKVAVQWEDSASQDQPKPLAAREDEPTSVVVAKATTTRTVSAEVIANPTSETLILPFHFSVTEYCDNGSKKVKGRYSNGLSVNIDLWPGLIAAVKHGVGHFPPLEVGDFKYDSSRLRFHYADKEINCEWFDDETWKRCGECRAGLWSGAPLNCASGGSRTKEMDCSFILKDSSKKA